MVSRIGYNVHSTTGGIQRGWSDKELNYFFDHIQRLKPTVLLFLDQREWALEAHRLLPDCRVVFRRYFNRNRIDEGNMWMNQSAQWHLDNFARDAEGGLALNIWNEPVPGTDSARTLAEHYAAVMDAFGALQIPIVGPNFGVGFPNENWVNLLEPMWIAFDRWHNLHDYGIHEYGTHRGMIFFEPNHSFNVFPYRIGRQTDFCTVPYLLSRNHIIPNMTFTEWGVDSAFDGTTFRGWRTCWDENQFARELIAADHKIADNHPYIRGYCIFSYGDTGHLHTSDDWSTFNVIDAFSLHQKLEANKSTVVAAVPDVLITPPPAPVIAIEPPANNPIVVITPLPPAVVPSTTAPVSPSQPILIGAPDGVWKTGKAKINLGAFVNVRDARSLSGKSIGKIYPDQTITYQEEQIDKWWCIKLDNQIGYALSTYLEPQPAPPDTYQFSFVLTLHAGSQESAQQVASYLIDHLAKEYHNLKDASDKLSNLSNITDLSITRQL